MKNTNLTLTMLLGLLVASTVTCYGQDKVKTINGLSGNITLQGSGNVSVTASGNTLTITDSGVDDALRRGSRRGALNQWWVPQSENGLGLTSVGLLPQLVASDGADLWVANLGGTVSRVRASDGRLLETWGGASGANGILVAAGQVFITGLTTPGALYRIDPTQSPGTVTTVINTLGGLPQGITFDGSRIWTANRQDSISIISLNPVNSTTISTGFTFPVGILFDGTNIWVTTSGTNPGKLLKLNSNGDIIQAVNVGADPRFPVFDGSNIWVPNFSSDSVTVVHAMGPLAGTVAATLNGNGLHNPQAVSFDGERIAAVNFNGNSVSLWRAADLTPLGSFSTGADSHPGGVCSDGLNFWINLQGPSGAIGRLARF